MSLEGKQQSTRTVRLPLATSVYMALEAHAIEDDIGVSDIIRRIIIRWSDEHPIDLPSADS